MSHIHAMSVIKKTLQICIEILTCHTIKAVYSSAIGNASWFNL